MHKNCDKFTRIQQVDYFSGEILIIEKPIAGVFKNNMWMFNCNYCFKRCLSAIPCSKCSQVNRFLIHFKLYECLMPVKMTIILLVIIYRLSTVMRRVYKKPTPVTTG